MKTLLIQITNKYIYFNKNYPPYTNMYIFYIISTK